MSIQDCFVRPKSSQVKPEVILVCTCRTKEAGFNRKSTTLWQWDWELEFGSGKILVKYGVVTKFTRAGELWSR